MHFLGGIETKAVLEETFDQDDELATVGDPAYGFIERQWHMMALTATTTAVAVEPDVFWVVQSIDVRDL